MLVVLTAEKDLLLEDDNFESLKKKGNWLVVSPIDSNLAKIHQAKAYFFCGSVSCLGNHAQPEPSDKLKAGG